MSDLNIVVKKLQKRDIYTFQEVIKLFEEVFEMKDFTPPDSHHLKSLLSQPDFFVFAAFIGDEVVGGLTAYVLEQYYSEKPLAYIFDLAVAVPHQRKGIGKKLINATNDYCRERGFEEVFVQADKVDDYALNFYRSTKPTGEEQVVHFTYSVDHKTQE